MVRATGLCALLRAQEERGAGGLFPAAPPSSAYYLVKSSCTGTAIQGAAKERKREIYVCIVCFIWIERKKEKERREIKPRKRERDGGGSEIKRKPAIE